MEPLDLSKAPPRSPKAELDGLVMLPRTIDKLRATLPGGNPGPYRIPGFSQRMLDAIGVTEDELRQVVADARDDEDVATWLRAHANTAGYAEYSTMIRNRSVDDVKDRADLIKRYPILERRPDLYYLADMLEADDAEMFPS
ncbi:MAG: DUF5069 domain-containing protein [Candidatus Eremiobacteraeota bacterium]|nr:DUF5069 domain-containing protein [Candidatus Eremiobacteraeota bacterium]MBV9278369.1 DUF5069 domain-containing protein [Candidatus Eremiobacteraeota bacterium]